jgi:hypothetical protein
MTGCVSSSYHCQFYDFFETTCHGGPDDLGTISWQKLAGFSCTAQILSDLDLTRPMQSSMVSQAIPLGNRPDDLDDFSVPQVDFDIVIDGKSFADRESQTMGPSGNSC